jgi:hypothetical protein
MEKRIRIAILAMVPFVLGLFFAAMAFAGEKSEYRGSAISQAGFNSNDGVSVQPVDWGHGRFGHGYRGYGHRGHDYRGFRYYPRHYFYPRHYSYPRRYFFYPEDRYSFGFGFRSFPYYPYDQPFY